jgi:hypothetical protein
MGEALLEQNIGFEALYAFRNGTIVFCVDWSLLADHSVLEEPTPIVPKLKMTHMYT